MWIWCLSIGICSAKSLVAVEVGEKAPHFEGEMWDSGETVKLADFEGEILVLDFFAYWCVPCRHSSPLLETEIQSYYEEEGGNVHGIPVRVISVNVEQGNRERTARFLAETGSSYVVNDRDGENLKRFGAKGIPYFVVVDGTKGKAGEPWFEIAYRNSGFEGVEKLRGIIDGIKKADTHAEVRQAESVRLAGPSGRANDIDRPSTSDPPGENRHRGPNL